MNRRYRLMTAALALAALPLAGCGQAGSSASRQAASGPAGPSSPTSTAGAAAAAPATSVMRKEVARGSGDLAVSIRPAHGPVGTRVTVRATNCLDPDGQNHAVSFNPAPMDRFGRTVRIVGSTLTGRVITGSYTITAADAAAASAPTTRFFVQCATDLGTADFTITP